MLCLVARHLRYAALLIFAFTLAPTFGTDVNPAQLPTISGIFSPVSLNKIGPRALLAPVSFGSQARNSSSLPASLTSGIPFYSTALDTSINGPTELSFDKSGFLYIVESVGQRVLRLDIHQGSIKVVVRAPTKRNQDAFEIPNAIAANSRGDLYIADFNGRLRRNRINSKGFDLIVPSPPAGQSGVIDLATEMVFDAEGNLLIADEQGHRVLRMKADGSNWQTVAGTGKRGFSGDGNAATEEQLAFPMGVAVDRNGDIIVADSENCRIRKVDSRSGAITTIAGTGECKDSGDGLPAIHASLSSPSALAADPKGSLFIVESAGQRVRKIDAAGVITTYAGTGAAGFSGDGGPANRAKLNNPSGIAVDPDGNVYIAEYINNRIRRVDARTRKISTAAGNGEPARLDILL